MRDFIGRRRGTDVFFFGTKCRLEEIVSKEYGFVGSKEETSSDHGGVVVAVGKKFLTVVIGFVVSIRSLLDTLSFGKLYQLIFWI